jgi:hypothetical protein
MTDPYVDPETGTLRNLAGITDPERLKQVEAAITAPAIYALDVETIPRLVRPRTSARIPSAYLWSALSMGRRDPDGCDREDRHVLPATVHRALRP